MYRSTSWHRIPDDDHTHAPPMASTIYRMASLDGSELPTYDPHPSVASSSEMVRKEKLRAKFAENAVHFIPLVLLFCAFVLWLFSNPDINAGLKPDQIAERTKGLNLEGEFEGNTDGTQAGLLPALEANKGGSLKQRQRNAKASRKWRN